MCVLYFKWDNSLPKASQVDLPQVVFAREKNEVRVREADDGHSDSRLCVTAD